MSTEDRQFFERLEQKIDKIDMLLNRRPPAPPPEWISSTDFRKRTGKTWEQTRTLRKSHPTFFKIKPRTNRYLVNYTAYLSFYTSYK